MGDGPNRSDEIRRDPLYGGEPVERVPAQAPGIREMREPAPTERELRERARSGDEVARTRTEIEHTRADMTETVNALQERLSPQNLKEQAKVQAKETAREAGNGFVDRIKQNPIPAAMVGIGLGWLLRSGGSGSSGRQRYQEGPYYYERSYPDYYEEPGRSSSGRSRTGEAAGQAREKASELSGQAQERAQEISGQAQERAQELSNQAQQQAQRAKGGFQRMMRENPLAVGALAAGLGAAVGFSVPVTQKENQLMGETRDDLLERGKEKAEELKPKVRRVAEEAQNAAKEEAQNQDLSS